MCCVLVSLSCVSVFACEGMHIYTVCYAGLGELLTNEKSKPRFPHVIIFAKWEKSESLNVVPAEDGKQDWFEMVNTWHILACSILPEQLWVKLGQLIRHFSINGYKWLWYFRISSWRGNRRLSYEQLTSRLSPIQFQQLHKGKWSRGFATLIILSDNQILCSGVCEKLKPLICFLAERVRRLVK